MLSAKNKRKEGRKTLRNGKGDYIIYNVFVSLCVLCVSVSEIVVCASAGHRVPEREAPLAEKRTG